jgi:hypothetical protein
VQSRVQQQVKQPDIIDITPSKTKSTIRIQTDYDPLVNSYEDTVYSSRITSSSPQQQQQQQKPASKSKFEFKLLTDQNVAPQTTVVEQQQQQYISRQTNSSVNIAPISSNDDLLANLRMRQATHSTYVSDQIDQARQQQQQFNRSSSNLSTSAELQKTSSNWRLYAIIIAVIFIIILFYNFFLSSSNGDESLYDLN